MESPFSGETSAPVTLPPTSQKAAVDESLQPFGKQFRAAVGASQWNTRRSCDQNQQRHTKTCSSSVTRKVLCCNGLATCMLFAGTPQPNPAICFSMMLHAAYAAKLYKERERERVLRGGSLVLWFNVFNEFDPILRRISLLQPKGSSEESPSWPGEGA